MADSSGELEHQHSSSIIRNIFIFWKHVLFLAQVDPVVRFKSAKLSRVPHASFFGSNSSEYCRRRICWLSSACPLCFTFKEIAARPQIFSPPWRPACFFHNSMELPSSAACGVVAQLHLYLSKCVVSSLRLPHRISRSAVDKSRVFVWTERPWVSLERGAELWECTSLWVNFLLFLNVLYK